MRTYKGNETVRGGYYLNRHEMKLEVIEEASGMLPGDEHANYVRIPGLALLFVAPLLGLLFVMVMPFLGMAVVIEQGGRKLATVLRPRPARQAEVIPARRR